MDDGTASSGWDAVDEADDPGLFRSYLDAVNAQDRMRALKRRSYRLLDPTAGDRLLDVGCGTGDDAAALADAVGSEGSVVGVDNSAAMVSVARDRAADSPAVSFRAADAESLPFDDGRFDGCRADRVLQHLDRPREAFAELRRVTRTGGRVAVTDSDWGTLVVDAPDAASSGVASQLLDPAWSCAANGRIGRRLRWLAVEAGLDDLDVDATALALTNFETAEEILGLTGRVERAVAAGAVAEDAADAWLDCLRTADEAGSFFASLTLYTVAGTATDEQR
jgi:SAM-dependent methyltransferase